MSAWLTDASRLDGSGDDVVGDAAEALDGEHREKSLESRLLSSPEFVKGRG